MSDVITPAAAPELDPALLDPPVLEEGLDPAPQEPSGEAPLPDDVKAALEAAKRLVERRNAGKAGAPAAAAYYLVVCGEHMVFLPPTLQQYMHVMKVAMAPDLERKAGAGGVLIANTLFWMRGQDMGQAGVYAPVKALEHFKAQRALGGFKVLLEAETADQLFTLLKSEAGEISAKKY